MGLNLMGRDGADDPLWEILAQMAAHVGDGLGVPFAPPALGVLVSLQGVFNGRALALHALDLRDTSGCFHQGDAVGLEQVDGGCGLLSQCGANGAGLNPEEFHLALEIVCCCES